MTSLLTTFKAVSMIFAASAIFTGIQPIIDPFGFARNFGLPLKFLPEVPKNPETAKRPDAAPNMSYVSLMGARQLATGLVLFTFAYQGKWQELATVLSIVGFTVPFVDGFYLYRSGARSQVWQYQGLDLPENKFLCLFGRRSAYARDIAPE